jgi:hypothetical protein
LLLFFDGIITGSDQAIFGHAVRLDGGNIQIHAPGYRAKASRLPTMYPLENADVVVQAATAQPQVVSAAKRINTNVISRGVAVALIAMLASLYPAWQAARQEPAEALHHA